VLRDVAEMWRYARRAGIARQLKSLHRPRLSRFLLAAAGDWGLIGLAAAAAMAASGTPYIWVAVPLALLVIGNRQRALGNLLHDASHWSMDGNRHRSQIVANLLFCWPLWVSMPIYRDEHNRHHRHLGDPARDPDFIHDENRLSRGWFSVWLDQMRAPQLIRSALIGDMLRMGWLSRLGVLAWWGGLLGLIAALAGTPQALTFLGLWLGAKATAFHAITAFREISDHVGLKPGSLIGFSRNHPFSSAAGHLIHPHHNGYHLLHHLNPGIPFHALPKAHALLLGWPRYAAGEHCDSYFSGRLSATRSWVRLWSTQADRRA
jgi:fatty acid desaturase